MAAQEQQDERVVRLGGRRCRRPGPATPPGGISPGDGVLPPLPGLLAAQQVGQPAGGDRDQPAARVVRDARRPATAWRPRAAPPAPRPRRCRSARSGAPPRRGPAAPAGAAGPRPRCRPMRSGLQVGLGVGDRPDVDVGPVRGTCRARGRPSAGRRSRWPGRSSRSRRSSSRPAPPGSRRTARRSPPGRPSRSRIRRVCTGAVRPCVSTSSPDSARSLLNDSMNAPIAAKSSADQAGLPGSGAARHRVVVLLRAVHQDHVLH